MSRRKNFISRFTYNILDNIPSWMKLRQESSNGFPFINVMGQELERIDDIFREGFNDIFVKTSNTNQINDLYYVDKNKLINQTQITSSGNPRIAINVIPNQIDFLTNKPTRVEYLDKIDLFSGLLTNLTSGIFNLNYFYDNVSGYYYVINDMSAVNPSSILIFNDQFRLLNHLTYASGRMDYDHYGAYEIVEPESSGYLESLYPTTRITYSGSTEDIIVNFKLEPHYEPQDASGWVNKWFYDSDYNLKYYETALNNPYGSGRYTLASGHLKYTPLSGTLRVYDILNLSISGTAFEIPATGCNVYSYTSSDGDFNYIGYYPTVPYVYDGYGGQTATLKYNTSWFQGRESGYLDNDVPPNSGTFQYIQGTGALIDVIWFNNAISKYMVTYDYSKFDYLQDMTTDIRYNHNLDILPTMPFIVAQNDDDYVGIDWEFAKSSISGLRINPDVVRPGRDVKVTMTFTDKYNVTWANPSGTAFNFQTYRKNLGYTQDIYDRMYL